MKIEGNLCSNELRKAGLLLVKASELGMDIANDCGELSVNTSSGFVYMWSESYSFTLAVDLADNIVAVWSSPVDGREEFFDVKETTVLDNLLDWVSDQETEDDRLHYAEEV